MIKIDDVELEYLDYESLMRSYEQIIVSTAQMIIDKALLECGMEEYLKINVLNLKLMKLTNELIRIKKDFDYETSN